MSTHSLLHDFLTMHTDTHSHLSEKYTCIKIQMENVGFCEWLHECECESLCVWKRCVAACPMYHIFFFSFSCSFFKWMQFAYLLNRHPLISLPASILWNQIKRICVYVCVFAWIVPKIKVSEWWGVEKKKEGKKRIYRWGRRRDRGSNEGSQMTVCWSEGILSVCAVCTMHGTNWMRLAWFQFSCVCLSLWTFIFI